MSTVEKSKQIVQKWTNTKRESRHIQNQNQKQNQEAKTKCNNKGQSKFLTKLGINTWYNNANTIIGTQLLFMYGHMNLQSMVFSSKVICIDIDWQKDVKYSREKFENEIRQKFERI